MDTGSEASSAEEWLLLKFSVVPNSSVGWFRAGVGFYNKKQFAWSIECFHRSVQLDPLNYNAYQIMARACIAVNRRDDAIEALKKSVKLDNPSDWQLLVELTRSKDNGQAATSNRNPTGNTGDTTTTSTPLTDSNDFPPVPPAEPAEDSGARPDYAPAAQQGDGDGDAVNNNTATTPNNDAANAGNNGNGNGNDDDNDNDDDDDDADNNSLTETTVATNPAQS